MLPRHVAGRKPRRKMTGYSEQRRYPVTTKVIENERTAMAQKVTPQPDGPGLRIGRRGELTGIGKVTPDGARIFRECLPQFQAEAAYWENRIGTVQSFRLFLFDNDTRILFTIVYDDDFKPYVEDLMSYVSPWMDQIFGGVWEGYTSFKDLPTLMNLIRNAQVTAEFFYAAYPEISCRDVQKMKRLSAAVSEMLDAAT
jgi:hypothetical protein